MVESSVGTTVDDPFCGSYSQMVRTPARPLRSRGAKIRL